ncbi:hypothetical protein MKW98_026051 [Papaver atlanticum]|uniref:Angio-associated migratory cell protein n=1 Tax=Papaver atlanticum TaxID=357466 RepID=A0AAD4RZC8_9MAGN|nr:hypothetical protein MKW98_026051 [Papaver atlanticum]
MRQDSKTLQTISSFSRLHYQKTEKRETTHGNEEQEDGDENREVLFLREEDVLEEINVDEEGEIFDADEDEPDDSMHIFTGHTGELYTVACSPTDATLVATGGRDDKGFLWKMGVGDWAQELQGHKDSVSSLAFSKDGQLLATGSLDGTIKVWDVPSGSLKFRWHPRGHVLAGSEDGNVWLWNADTIAYPNVFSGHAGSVTCGDFTPDGKIICTGSDDASLRVWNLETGESVHVIRGHPYQTEGLTCLVISSDSSLAITGSKDSSVHIVNLITGMVINSLLSHSDSVECIGLSPSHPFAATGGLDQKLIIWDLQQSIVRCTCDHEDGVTCMAWLGSSRYVVAGGLDGECKKIFNGHSDAIQSLSPSRNLDFLVSVSSDKTARVFEIAEFTQ